MPPPHPPPNPPVPPVPPRAASRRQPSGSSAPGRPSFELPPPALPTVARPPVASLFRVPGRPTSTPPSILRPPGHAHVGPPGLAATLSPPVPPKDYRPPQPPLRARSPTQSSGTGWQSARASTVRSSDSAWQGEHPRPARVSPPYGLGRPTDPTAVLLPPSRPSSRARTPSLKDSVIGAGGGPRLRSRPPTNHGGTVASTIEEVEEDQTDRSKRKSQTARD